MVPSYHPDLLRGVTPCWWEFLCAMPPLDMVYMPIGQGSGAGSAIAAKRAPGHSVRIVGVVSAPATTCADSIAAGHVVETPVDTELADGMACRLADAAWQERAQMKGPVVGSPLCGGSAVFAGVLAGADGPRDNRGDRPDPGCRATGSAEPLTQP